MVVYTKPCWCWTKQPSVILHLMGWYLHCRYMLTLTLPVLISHLYFNSVRTCYGGHSKSRNEEMRNGKGNEEMGRKHIAFYSANCWHFVTAVIKCDEKVYVHPAFIERIIYTLQFAPKGYVYNDIEYCIMVGKLVLQFWQLVRFLCLLNSWITHTLFQLSTRSHFEASLVSCFIREPHICIFVSHTCSTIIYKSMYYL